MPQSKKDKRKGALARMENTKAHYDKRPKQFQRSEEARQAEMETLRAKTR